MNTPQVAAMQLGFWHGALDGIIGDCTPDTLNRNLPDATITSIASIYAHMVWSEDTIVNGMLQGRPSIYQEQGWEARTGIAFPGLPPSMNPTWARAVRMNIAPFQEYARAVFSNTDAYLSNVQDADLQRKMQTPVGEQTAEWMIATVLATHVPQHLGEIAALKGVQGLKGLPF